MTQSIETDAEPDAVLGVLADPRHLPAWAPAFADEVTGDEGRGWQVVKDGRPFPLRVAVGHPSRTVDYLRTLPTGREGGAFLRVVPGPVAGSVIVMTLPVPPGTDPAAVAATLTAELAALVRLIM